MSVQAPSWVVVNRAVDSFEAARERGPATLNDFLPTTTDPYFLKVLAELARVEMELDWSERRPRVEDYLARFPGLANHPAFIIDIAAEEIRLRIFAGEKPTAEEYEARLGIAAENFHQALALAPVPAAPVHDHDLISTAVLPEKHDRRLPENLPPLGSEFGSFRLVAELGKGAFSRVYLARQPTLADRPVVLKLSACGGGEPQKLAQLQHTNIVPIYALYHHDHFEVICMPYFGPCTLQHIINHLQLDQQRPQSAAALLGACHAAALVGSTGLQSPEPIAPSIAAELKKRTYAEGVLWICCRLARGLAHAHERGILHLDLKPANILLSDSGQPMLLDFNLAYSSSAHGSTHVGGTLPYMAPEHLHALGARKFTLDHRADIFSMGVVLYQLLTGQMPFPAPPSGTKCDLQQLAQLRSRPIIEPALLNAQVSPAVAAIIHRCLQADPARRYQHAVELAEDLERQLAHQPLRFTSEPSWREATQKWLRRHPGMTSAGSVACIAALVLTGLICLVLFLREQVLGYEAEASVRRFRADLNEIRYLLHSPRSDRFQLQTGITRCQEALARLRYESIDLERFSRAEQQFVRDDIAEALFLLVRGSQRYAALNQSGGGTASSLQQWCDWNQQALAQYADRAAPQSLLRQQQSLRNAHPASEMLIGEAPANVHAHSVQDLYLTASDHLAAGQSQQARSLLRTLLDKQPNHLWGWVARGQCAETLCQWDEAIACYTTAIALGPDYSWPYYLRGLAELNAQRTAESLNDLRIASQKAPSWWEPYYAQCVALQRSRDYGQARTAVDKAMSCNGPLARLLFTRARLQHQTGEDAGAAADLLRARSLNVGDELALVASGLARLDDDPQAALADFEQALAVNPHCEAALRNKSHVLAEILDQPDAALATLDQLVRICPDDVKAQAARAVLLARLQRRDQALVAARLCLERSTAAPIEYQLAGVFALTSRVHPADADTALELLESALRSGWGNQLLHSDRDLDPLRDLPDFQRLVARRGTP